MRRRSPTVAGWTALAATAAVVAAGCARQEAPPGTLPDSRPPQVAEIQPGRDTVVPGFDGRVRVQYDEPLRLGNDFSRQVEGSPAYRYSVEVGRSDIRIRPKEGWRKGVVYTFLIPSGVSDLLNNRTTSPVEIQLSTGPPISSTRVSGRVRDRASLQAVRDARVLFLPSTGDSVPYTAVSDTGGRFRLDGLPPGAYRAFGFVDRNRNLDLDRRLEPYDSASFRLADGTTTAELDFELVEPDSTPPVLVRAEVVDSMTVTLTFDDDLDPGQPLPATRVRLTSLPSGTAWPVDSLVFGALTPAAPPDTAAPVPSDSAAGPPGASGGRARAAPGPAPDTMALRPATKEIGVRLARSLTEGRYRVIVDSVTNLRRLVGGGDTTFAYPPSEAP